MALTFYKEIKLYVFFILIFHILANTTNEDRLSVLEHKFENLIKENSELNNKYIYYELNKKLENLIKENSNLINKYISIEKSNYELKIKLENLIKENSELNNKYISAEKSNYELNKRIEKLENIINSRIPIYRLCNGREHFYCSSNDEKIRAQYEYGYKYERVEFYAFPE